MAAVLVSRFPEKTPETFAYQASIIQVEHNYEEKRWVVYDCQYRQEALWQAVWFKIYSVIIERYLTKYACVLHMPTFSICLHSPYAYVLHMPTSYILHMHTSSICLRPPHAYILQCLCSPYAYVLHMPTFSMCLRPPQGRSRLNYFAKAIQTTPTPPGGHTHPSRKPHPQILILIN